MALYLGSNKYAGSAFIDTKTTNATASASKWTTATSSTTPSNSICAAYQTVAVSGVNANSKIIAGLAENCTVAQRQAGANAELFVYSVSTNSIVLCCTDSSYIPSIDIPISIWIIATGV